MKLVDITNDNWEDVIFLTTNETIYEKVGFRSENKMIDEEELFKIVLD